MDEFELFFRFRANDAPVEFTTLADVYGLVVDQYPCSPQQSLQLAAWDSDHRLGLIVTSPQGLQVRTYTIAERVDDPHFRMVFYYRGPDGIDYFAEPVLPEDATLMISHAGPRTIEGTFFGVLKAEGHPDVIITEGEFTVRREHDPTRPPSC